MLNEVQIEGIIARAPWMYDKDLFFRIASYRDADMPAKPDITPGWDEPDHVNVRVPGGATSLMVPKRGDRKNGRTGVSVLQKSNFRRTKNVSALVHNDEHHYLTLDEVAERLSVSPSSAHNLVTSSELPSIRVGRFIRVSRTDLETYLASNLGQYYTPDVKIFRVEYVSTLIFYAPTTIYTKAAQKKIPSVKIRTLVRVASTQLEAYLNGQYTPPDLIHQTDPGQSWDKIDG